MLEANYQESGTDTMTLAVESDGRIYSPSPTPSPEPPKSGVRKLRDRREETELPSRLRDALLSRLPWKALPDDEADRTRLVEVYVESLHQIGQFRQDADHLIRYACLANLEFRQAKGETNTKARDDALGAKLNEMLAEAASHWPAVKNVLEAKLVSQHETTLRNHLNNSLTEAVGDFSRHFFELLAKLVERRMFGLVEWLPNHCCKYHFFKRVVIQENEGGAQRVIETRFDNLLDIDSDSGRRIIGRQTIEDTRGQGKHYHRFARHEHSVMNAVCTTIGNSQVVMPPGVVRLVEEVPEWLYPFVKVIDGDIFRERIIEEDTKVEQWADVQVRDEPIFGCEPGVIIGKYVLTGWGPREVAQEQDRRQSLERSVVQKSTERTASSRASWFVLAAVALTLVAVFLLIQSLRGGGGMVFAVLAAVGAIGSVWQATFDIATARKTPTAAQAAHWLAGSVACQLLLAGWCIARWFMPLSWVTPVVLVVGAAVSLAVSRRFV